MESLLLNLTPLPLSSDGGKNELRAEGRRDVPQLMLMFLLLNLHKRGCVSLA